MTQSVMNFNDRTTQISFTQRDLFLNEDFRRTENMNIQTKDFMGNPFVKNAFLFNQ